MSGTPTVLVVSGSATIADVRARLRELAETSAAVRAAGRASRTWAILGELAVAEGRTENESVVDHDLIGRQAVRLAVDKTLCVGDSRAVRALHQGAVMEGSWGDEVRMVDSVAQAQTVLTADDDWNPGNGDVVLIAAAGGRLDTLREIWSA